MATENPRPKTLTLHLRGHYALSHEGRDIVSADPLSMERPLFFDDNADAVIVPKLVPLRLYTVTVTLTPVE